MSINVIGSVASDFSLWLKPTSANYNTYISNTTIPAGVYMLYMYPNSTTNGPNAAATVEFKNGAGTSLASVGTALTISTTNVWVDLDSTSTSNALTTVIVLPSDAATVEYNPEGYNVSFFLQRMANATVPINNYVQVTTITTSGSVTITQNNTAVYCIGGGGGSGSQTAASGRGSGGGGSGYLATGTLNAGTYTATIGAGGTGPLTGSTAGGTGGTTSISTISAAGGSGSSSVVAGAGGSGGGGSAGSASGSIGGNGGARGASGTAGTGAGSNNIAGGTGSGVTIPDITMYGIVFPTTGGTGATMSSSAAVAATAGGLYCGGGGGGYTGSASNVSNGASAAANTGGGAGGCLTNSANDRSGGTGGSGVIFLKATY